jgi:hypothetical protein
LVAERAGIQVRHRHGAPVTCSELTRVSKNRLSEGI